MHECRIKKHKDTIGAHKGSIQSLHSDVEVLEKETRGEEIRTRQAT